MRFYQKKQVGMLEATLNLLKNEREKVAGRVPALKELIKTFESKCNDLDRLKSSNPAAVMHETLSKAVAKDAFAEVVMKLSGVVKAANYGKKTTGAGQKNYTLWSLKKLSAVALCEFYAATLKEAKKIGNLEYYGFSGGDLKEAQAYYKEFAAVKAAPAKRKKEVAERNKKMKNMIRDAIDFLEHTIDPLMRLASEGNTELRMNYKSVRSVMPRGQGRPSDAEAAYRKSRHHRKPLPRDEGPVV